MPKVTITLILLWSLYLSVQSQERGIRFEDSMSWQKVQAEAKVTNKYIFVDCYTTWCGPCKYMADSIFTMPEVGAFVNARFVSISLQMDKTKNDPDLVKAWYATSDTLAKAYAIRAFPTFLFFAPDGQIVHRIVGAIRDPQRFMARLNEALDTSKQYYTVIGHFAQHLEDSAFLRNALKLAIDLGDKAFQAQVSDTYVSCLQNPLTQETLRLLRPAVQNLNGPAFHLFLEHPAEVDTAFHSNVCIPFLVSLIYRTEIDSLVRSGLPIDWSPISLRLQKLYPLVAEQVILMGKINYYKNRKDEQRFNICASRYMDLLEAKASDYELNEVAWEVFQVSHDREVLDRALEWSKRSIATYPKVDWEFLDTYANLLYKTGHKEEAIAWEEKAIDLAKNVSQKKAFKQSLLKMERGEKTWD